MTEVERHKLNLYWICPYCGKHVGFPMEARGHLITEHSPTDASASVAARSLPLPDFGNEEDREGKRFRLCCPFCSISPYHSSFKTKADLKTHLTSVHGCS